ncbi:MAG: hypothetical protein M5T61_15020 [Acidimicrobiia bacterium]|nr:hypothetical protein [Acidimicrobiia bacterium]
MKLPRIPFRRRTRLTCAEVGRLVQAHLDGEADGDTARRVGARLRAFGARLAGGETGPEKMRTS